MSTMGSAINADGMSTLFRDTLYFLSKCHTGYMLKYSNNKSVYVQVPAYSGLAKCGLKLWAQNFKGKVSISTEKKPILRIKLGLKYFIKNMGKWNFSIPHVEFLIKMFLSYIQFHFILVLLPYFLHRKVEDWSIMQAPKKSSEEKCVQIFQLLSSKVKC